MKRIIMRVFAVILAIASLLLIAYPFVSNYLMSLNQESQIVAYEQEVKKVSQKEKNREYEKARAYNAKFLSNVVITDPFDPNYQLPEDVEYENTLNFGEGIMGSVEIPSINVYLPIFHGTSVDVLKKGIGHMQNTSLPVGGDSTHSVLTGHTGIPSAKLFTDLDRVEKGDVFYIHVMGDIRAYKVVKKYIIDPNDTDSLMVYPGKDYVSLITCTPYGVNSHRLIVRGENVPYSEKEYQEQRGKNRDTDSTWMREYRRALILGGIVLGVILLIFIIIRIIIFIHRKKKNKNNEGSPVENNTG